MSLRPTLSTCALRGGRPRDARIQAGRIDWPTIKDRIDLAAVATALLGAPIKRSGSRSAWLCPFHDDRNPSFTVDPKGWRCWACGIGGDAVALIRRLDDGLSFPEAVARASELAGIVAPSGPRPRTRADPTRPSVPTAGRSGKAAGRLDDGPKGLSPSDARTLVDEAAARIWAPQGADAFRYLEGRGLSPETIRRHHLGWTPRVMLPTADGLRYWRAFGVVIPWFDGDRLARVKIRQPDGRKPRYAEAYADGWRIFPGPEAVQPGLPLVAVEGELDAVLLQQELGDLAAVITTGSSSTPLDPSMLPGLLRCPRWFVAHDADKSGDDAAADWPARAVRVRPPGPGKDWTDARQAGTDLRRWWIENELPEAFAREERSAIMEFDGGLDREEAERRADVLTKGKQGI